MEQMSWKMLIVTKAFLLYLTCAFKVTVARQQEGVCATCHVNATCDDKRDGRGGKVCNCMYGFLGNGRTRCQDKDECQIGGGKICGDHTVCHNTYGSFYCTCLSGYSPSNSLVIFIPNDGTQCNDIDECKVQGICGEGGWCINMQGDFNCRCRAGYKVQNGSQPFHPHRDKAVCTAIDCGQPPSVTHAAQLSEAGTRYGSVAQFGCVKGFFQTRGNNTAVCGEKGVWEGLSLVCEEINCGPPAVFPNTDIHWDNTTRLGSVVHYTCKNGFYQEGGSSNSTCSSAREWEHITITCKEINCGPPDVFPNTDIHWDNTTRLGSVVHYTCKNGFYQEGGSSNSTCSSAREWEHITITCKARCGPPPSLPHTEVEWQNGSIAGSVALHSCQKGYRSWRGVNLSLCADTGRWQAATLFCREIKPAISKLLIFNEKCLRWKAERYDGQGEDYTVQIVGSRDYQRTFQYKRKRVFSTAADWPELCLNLLPGTNYTINITALSAGFSSIISANTSIQAPPVPEVVFRDVEVPLPSLRLRRSINTLDPISVYQVFVVPLERPVAFDCRSVSESHYHRQRPMGLYVAAQIPVVDIGRELSFTLGDQRYYGEYYNAPLLPGRDYYIILRAVNQWGRVRKQSCVFWAKARGTPYIIQSATMVTGGLIGLVAFVIFLGWYCKNK
ncbi:sushi domain-containing protein 1 isoform X7 [Conger conger]|uniref:sushi domain-containing protein 1 isoform X7 n=1 Tax=Conger conger TaxID=82655 RepID=UPI002A5AAB78|nr:sushi domain-containing protein 1 isoform X7 [Conger conger]